MYVNDIELSEEDYEYLSDNIEELDNFLFADMTAKEVIEEEIKLRGE